MIIRRLLLARFKKVEDCEAQMEKVIAAGKAEESSPSIAVAGYYDTTLKKLLLSLQAGQSIAFRQD